MKKYSLLTLLLALFTVTAFAQTTAENMENQNSLKPVDGVVVNIETSMGNIKALLYNDTPLHRDNFLKLVKEGFYDGVLFHRVINQFMIQTGDPDSKNAAPGQELGSGSPDYTIQAEFDFPHHFHKYGALAAARTGDQVNPERRSSSSQFYIVTGRKFEPSQLERLEQQYYQNQMQEEWAKLLKKNAPTIEEMQKANDKEALEKLRQDLIKELESNFTPKPMPQEVKDAYATVGGAPHLDGQYTVFGEVLEGMDVVEKIQKVETDSNDRPKEDVRVIRITVE